jgi:outer membrane lipase/esterase
VHPIRKLLATAVLLSCAGAASAAYSGVYIFGNSLSDTGNVAALVGANGAQVIGDNGYIPNQPYGSGQFTNGNVWAKSFTEALGQAAYGSPSLLGGGNFAFGGARTATDGAGQPPSLWTQASLFLGAVSGVAPSQALYVVEGGGNDARDMLAAAATSANPSTVIAAGAAAYANSIGQVVDRLQAAGAQDIVVWDVPNLGLAPAVTSLGVGAAFLGSQVTNAMNSALSARLSLEAGVSIFDVYGLQNTIAANPAAYGLSNVTDACGAVAGCDGGSHFYWDGIHPTEAVHSLIAQGMLESIAPAVPEPATWALLAGGLMTVGLRARRRREGRPG